MIVSKGREEIRADAERLVQAVLGLSLEDAFLALDAGQLNGTIIQAELSMTRLLLKDD